MAKIREIGDQLNLSSIAATNKKILSEQQRTNELLEELLTAYRRPQVTMNTYPPPGSTLGR